MVNLEVYTSIAKAILLPVVVMQDFLSTLRLRRFDLIRDPASRKEEQSDQCPALSLRIVMATRCRRCPPLTAPSIESGEKRRPIEWHYQVDLAVRVEVVVASKDEVGVFPIGPAVHVDGCDTEVGCFGTRLQDPTAPIPRTVEFDICCPTFLNASRY